MRLTCPNCEALYDVPDDVIPPGGREVQCSNCGESWFQAPPDVPPDARPEMPAETVDLPQEDPEEPPSEQDEPEAPPRRELDPILAAVLRQEAAREQTARAHERAAPPDQADPGPSAPARPSGDMPPNSPSVQGPGVQGPEAALIGAGATLAAGAPAPVAAPPGDTRPSAGAFRLGFGLAVALAVVAVAAYLFAPAVADRVPALDAPLSAYVAMVECGRSTLAGMAASFGVMSP